MRLLLSPILLAVLALAQVNRAETFDTSGMPRRATNFVEQAILDLIGHHESRDLVVAGRIQRKLGRYYADKGDQRRAKAAFLAAAAAEQTRRPTPPPADTQTVTNNQAPRPPSTPAATKPAFTGNYYGMDGRTLHTWEFHSDATFLHTWISSGAGTNVRNSERGSFRLVGDTVELKLSSTTTGFTTPGVGGRSMAVGGGDGRSTETRSVSIGFADSNLVLDGVRLKPKSW
jgi:hypothetical protein